MQPRQKLVPLRVAAPLTMGAAILGSILGFALVSALKAKPAPTPTASSATPGAQASTSTESSSAAAASDAAASATVASDGAAGDAKQPANGASDGGAPNGDVDLSDAGLKPYEAYLFVRSSASADVWVHGIKIGRTNEKLKLACTKGLRFTRLGQEPGPAWISDASSILIPCGSVTQVDLEPSEQKVNALPLQAGQPQPNPGTPLPKAKISKDNPY